MGQRRAAVIFDLDGTLLDTIGDLADAGNHVLQTHGFPTHTEEAYMRMVGDGIRELITRMLPQDSREPERVTGMLCCMEQCYRLNWNVRTRMYPGIANLLDGLQEQNTQLAVLSNKPHIFTVEMVQEFLGRWHFDPVIGAKPDGPKKPSPESAFSIARQWRMAPSDCILVGDSEPDIRTARAAGMTAVAVAWGFRSFERLALESPDHIIRSPGELIDVIRKRLRSEDTLSVAQKTHPDHSGSGVSDEHPVPCREH